MVRLALVVSFGLAIGWLDPVGRVFGERVWRADEVHASCTALNGLYPQQVELLREGDVIDPEYLHTVAECERVHPTMFVPAAQSTWAHVRAIDDLDAIGISWQLEVDQLEEHIRSERATIGQRVWHDLFRMTMFLSAGKVGREDVMVWDQIATATLSCLLAMLIAGLALRRIGRARGAFAVV